MKVIPKLQNAEFSADAARCGGNKGVRDGATYLAGQPKIAAVKPTGFDRIAHFYLISGKHVKAMILTLMYAGHLAHP
jgi:hypothetical protein